MTDVMAWSWIVVAIVVPMVIGLAIACPFWLWKANDSIGSILAGGAVFVACLTFIGREYIQVQRVTNACLEAGRVCAFKPEPFTRFCIYGFIALLQAFVLFVVGLSIEERIRRRDYASEWQGR
jgi:hypothetical protein